MRRRYFFLLLAALVLLVYSPVRVADFIWDDDAHVTANPNIVGPLGLKEIWTSAAANYFPLTMTSFWVLHALWGLDPLPYHIVSVLLHVFAAGLLFAVLQRLRVPWAWLGALLWALHPVQVESVAWISELKNTQSAVFYLLAIWFFLRWLDAGGPEAKGRRDYAAALACALLAILSKSSTVMLPVVLGLIAWWRGERRLARVAWLVPFFLLSLVASGWTIWEQKVHSMASGSDWALSLPQRLALSGQVVWFYLGKLIWPQPLIFIYPRWEIDATHPLEWLPVLAAAGAAIAVAVALRRGSRVGRTLALAGGYFVVSLFPVLGFFDVFFFRYSFVGDHLQYLATIGPLALAGAGIGLVADRWRSTGVARLAIPAALAGLLGLLSWQQCKIYRNDEALWHDTVTLNPRAWIGHNNLGRTFVGTGRPALALVHLEKARALRPDDPAVLTNLGNALIRVGRPAEAIPVLESIVRLRPAMAEAHNSLGYALWLAGRPAEAFAHYEEAIRLRPDYSEAYFNHALGLTQQGDFAGGLARYETALRLQPRSPGYLNAVGRTLRALGRGDEAIARFEATLREDPNNRDAHAALAQLAVQRGQLPAAAAHAEAALRTPGEQPDMRHVLGHVLWRAGRGAEAVPQYEAALRVQPDLLEARSELAILLYQLGRHGEALAHLETLVRQHPDWAEAHNNLAAVLSAAGKNGEAIAHYTEAVRLKPEYADARANLGVLLAQAGRIPEAVAQWEEALRLQPNHAAAQRGLAEARAARERTSPP